jgi:two-component system KDP operon response regulator KdpE
VLLHDPVVHEAFGRIATGVDGSAIVWTGSLVIDRWAKTATSAGRLVPLTPRYWGILDYLAGQLGRRCSHAEILADVWGPGSRDDAHLLRVNIARLRERLGDNARLIETAPGLGYRLLHVEPIESPSR